MKFRMNLLFLLTQCWAVVVTCKLDCKQKYRTLDDLEALLEGKLEEKDLRRLNRIYADLILVDFPVTKRTKESRRKLNVLLQKVNASSMSPFQRKLCYNILVDSVKLQLCAPGLQLSESEKTELQQLHDDIMKCETKNYTQDHERRKVVFEKASRALVEMHFSAKFPMYTKKQPKFYAAVEALWKVEREDYATNTELNTVLAVNHLLSYYETVKEDKKALKRIKALANIMKEVCKIPVLLNSAQYESLAEMVKDINKKVQ